MVLLRADNLTKSFGETTLFSNVGFTVMEKQRLGLVGVNGSGKTTLMRILCALDTADTGQITLLRDRRIGHLAQHAQFDPEQSLYDETLRVFSDLMAAEAELDALHETLESHPDNLEDLVKHQATLYEHYQAEGGLTYRARTRSTLLGMGFSESDLSLSMSALSGGQKSKVQMAKLLLSRSDLLMLDEPTNHLDIGSVEWLESYLLEYPGSMVIISHDRYFLDRVTTGTLELENGHLQSFEGNYTAYLAHKQEQREIDEKHFQTAQKEIKRMEEMITRFRSWNRERSIRTAEHKEHQLEKLRESVKKPETSPMAIRFALNAKEGGGQDVLIAQNLKKSYEKPLFENVDLLIKQGERVFLLGPNGCGKTTLMRILLGQILPDSGTVRLGARIFPGYYDQHQSSLRMNGSPVSEIQDAYPALNDTQARNALAAFLFRGDDAFKPISALSGGERARVELLKLMLGQYNFLLLDEPTNHLDAPSREALEAALLDYDGTILAISHDRYLVNRLATRVLALSPDGLYESIGNYDDYLAHIAQQPKEQSEQTLSAKAPSESAVRRDNAAQQRRYRAQLRKAEEDIANLEQAIAQQQALLADPDVASDYQRILMESEKLESQKSSLEQAMNRWEELFVLVGEE